MSLLLVIIDVVYVGWIACKVIEQRADAVVRTATHFYPSTEVNSEFEDLHDVEVEIRTQIVSLVTEVLGGVCVRCVEQASGVYVTEVHVVAGI